MREVAPYLSRGFDWRGVREFAGASREQGVEARNLGQLFKNYFRRRAYCILQKCYASCD